MGEMKVGKDNFVNFSSVLKPKVEEVDQSVVQATEQQTEKPGGNDLQERSPSQFNQSTCLRTYKRPKITQLT